MFTMYSIQDNEDVILWSYEPDNEPPLETYSIAVQLRSIEPPGPLVSEATRFAVIAADRNDKSGDFQWLQLCPSSKERVGGLLVSYNCTPDRWYFIALAKNVDQESDDEMIQPTMYGKSAIRTSNNSTSQTFHLPNGVEVRIPDDVAANEKFNSDPPSASACYLWLSGVVVKSRIGHESLGEPRRSFPSLF